MIHLDKYPLVTIAFLSWNRYHYLRSTVQSAKICIDYPNIEWIISDNNSSECGIKQFIKGLDWVDKKIFKSQSHANAMNELIKVSNGKYIIIWPDDIQFDKKGSWLKYIIEILEKHSYLGSIGLAHVRDITNKKIFTYKKWLQWRQILKEIYFFKNKFRFQKRLKASNGFEIRTLGHVWPGICGSGIPTITKTSIWKQLGNWTDTEKRNLKNLNDSSPGSEANMVKRFYEQKIPFQQALLSSPVASEIITDPIGTKARVRGQFRYGVYSPPKKGKFYYEIRKENSNDLNSYALPLSLESNSKPNGYSLPIDKNGNILKATDLNYDVVEKI